MGAKKQKTGPAKKRWSTRRGDSRDAGSVEDLFEMIWKYRRPAAYQKWLLEDNPAGPPCMMLAEDGNVLVGHYLVIPVKFFVDGREVLMGLDIDTMTHPAYRKQGVLKTLAAECSDWAADMGIAFTVGFLGEQSTVPYRKSLPFKEPLDVRARARPLRSAEYGRIISDRYRLPRVLGLTAGLMVEGYVTGYTGLRTKRSGLKFEFLDESNLDYGLFHTLWELNKPERGACLVRNGDFVRWRYARPGSQYRMLVAFQRMKPVGYACWREPEVADSNSGEKKLELVDLFGRDEGVVQGLVQEAVRASGKRVIRVTALANYGSPVDRSLQKIVMVRDAKRMKFILRVNRKDLVSYDRLVTPGVMDINYAFNDMI